MLIKNSHITFKDVTTIKMLFLMKKLILTAILVAASMLPADAKTARCYLKYQGNVYIDGPCEFTAGKAGDFDLNKDQWWVSMIILDDGWADGLWNADGGMKYGETLVPASHQHSYLGYLRREEDGACWSNHEARVCAW
ncbi:hypothetical protein [Pseudogemmobacter sp. W21_MBD1_M6]|uniref:hypothetical protein n=1 Tax=Pseudogemmobacter sp. W21_MBD1_M6 TaxID=3240271 RepID=UPI003F9EBA03